MSMINDATAMNAMAVIVKYCKQYCDTKRCASHCIMRKLNHQCFLYMTDSLEENFAAIKVTKEIPDNAMLRAYYLIMCYCEENLWEDHMRCKKDCIFKKRGNSFCPLRPDIEFIRYVFDRRNTYTINTPPAKPKTDILYRLFHKGRQKKV